MNATSQLRDFRKQLEAQGFELIVKEYLGSRRGLPDRVYYRKDERHATIVRLENGQYTMAMDA